MPVPRVLRAASALEAAFRGDRGADGQLGFCPLCPCFEHASGYGQCTFSLKVNVTEIQKHGSVWISAFLGGTLVPSVQVHRATIH